MTRPDIRFVVHEKEDATFIQDKVEGVSYVIGNNMAAKLCEQLESMHHTIGVLLEELDKLKFPPSLTINNLSDEELYDVLTKQLRKMSEN